MKRISVTYTSHKDFRTACKEPFTKTFTAREALYMSPTANALVRLICALEELHGRHLLGSDQILEIARA